MEAYEPFPSLAVALAVGLVIGLEREQSTTGGQANVPASVGGARTYPLFALAGAVAALLSRTAGAWILIAAFIGLMSFVLFAYAYDLRRQADRGVTSEVSFGVTFLLGALALSTGIVEPTGRRLILVAGLGVAVTALLSVKPQLQRVIARTSREDVFATLKFLVVAVIVLPLLPNRTYGPLSVLNPFEVGLMVVLIAGIGFAGYVAVRVLGTGKGLGLTGLIGGLVSSTSVTLSFSGRARREPHVAAACAMAVVGASTIMFPRVLVEVAVINPQLLPAVSIPLGAMAVTGALTALYFYWRVRNGKPATHEGPISVQNPFELGEALKFGALYALVLMVSKAATEYLGTGGTYLAGVLAGTTDVDAITLSMANQAKDGLSPLVASSTIMLGAASNTVVKAVLAISLGGWAFGKRVAAAFSLILAAGAVGVAVLWLQA